MELFKLFGTIAINNSDANKAIDDTSDKAVESNNIISGAFDKIGKAAVAVGKTMATGLAVGAGAIGKLTKDAVANYADYEQLVGGVETLFKDNSSKVIKYANSAYKTAGLSANDYMETVTGFSASLLQSLAGDTDAAADKANQALVDMSDNANKMGTSMESIKNAYQGFAKQNYTMLDNLKLGYGGTKEEMARLLSDAKAISGVEYDISSFGDIVDAIHVVQTEMGITGTTAEEAATTISGSIGMMKGAWTNLLTGMSDSSQDIDLLLNNFVDSVITVVGNIAPRLVETVPRLVEGLVQVIENLTPYIAPMIEELLPELLNGAARLVVYLVEHIPELVVSLGSALFDALKLIFSEVSGLLSPEAENSFSVISNVFQNIWDLCVDIWEKFGQPLVDGITQAVSDLTTWISTNSEEINETVDSVFSIISSVIESALNFYSQSWENIGQPLIDRITDAVSTIAEWISSHADEISAAVDAALSIISTIAEDTWNFIFQVWDTVGQPLFDTITSAVETIAEWITTHADEINEKIDFVFGMISDAFALCWDVCQTLWDTVGQPIFDIICDTVEILQKWFEDNFGSMEEVVGNAFGEISVFWEEHLKPCFEAIGQFISEYLAPVFTEVFENGILPVVTEVFGFISDLWTYTLKPIFTGIIDFITGVFSGDWEKAWDGVVEIFKGIFNLIPTIVEGVINGAIAIINGIIYGINALTGLIGIPEIPEIPNVSIPRLEQGGVLEKGQVGLLEGNGAEAVVPLENNKKWISKVAADMNAETGIGNNETLEKILSVLEEILQTLPDTLVDAITSGTRFEVNNREFARLVKAVN